MCLQINRQVNIQQYLRRKVNNLGAICDLEAAIGNGETPEQERAAFMS